MCNNQRALYLVMVGLINFLSMPGELYPADPFAWREEARSIINKGALSIAPSIALGRGERGQFYAKNERNGKWYSRYGVMNGIINVVPLLAEKIITGELPQGSSSGDRKNTPLLVHYGKGFMDFFFLNREVSLFISLFCFLPCGEFHASIDNIKPLP